MLCICLVLSFPQFGPVHYATPQCVTSKHFIDINWHTLPLAMKTCFVLCQFGICWKRSMDHNILFSFKVCAVFYVHKLIISYSYNIMLPLSMLATPALHTPHIAGSMSMYCTCLHLNICIYFMHTVCCVVLLAWWWPIYLPATPLPCLAILNRYWRKYYGKVEWRCIALAATRSQAACNSNNFPHQQASQGSRWVHGWSRSTESAE